MRPPTVDPIMTSLPGTLSRRFRVSLLLALAEALPRGSACAVAFVATSAHRSRLPRACALGRRGKGPRFRLTPTGLCASSARIPWREGIREAGARMAHSLTVHLCLLRDAILDGFAFGSFCMLSGVDRSCAGEHLPCACCWRSKFS